MTLEDMEDNKALKVVNISATHTTNMIAQQFCMKIHKVHAIYLAKMLMLLT